MPAPSATNRLAGLRHLAETVGVAAIGGAALGLAGVPAGWLSGSILAVAGAALAGRPMFIPTLLMRAIFILIGISLGAVVTPDTLHGMATYPLSIGVLLLAMIFISASGAGYLRLVHNWGKVDAYLAAAPGGMSQVLALGAELGGDLRAIAIVQSIRVVVIAVGLPAGLSALGSGRPCAAQSHHGVEHRSPGRTRNPGRGFERRRCHCLPFPVSRWITLRGDDVFRDIAREWSDPGGYAVVGCERRNGRDGRNYRLAFRQYSVTTVAEFYHGGIRFVRGGSDDSRSLRRRADQCAVIAGSRSHDCVCSWLG